MRGRSAEQMETGTLLSGWGRKWMKDLCRQAAPKFVEEVQQDGGVDRSGLLAPGFRRSEHYKAPAVRCDVQIPKGVVGWPEERLRRPQPGFLGDEGVLIGRVAGDHDAVVGIHVEQFPAIARPDGELSPALRYLPPAR